MAVWPGERLVLGAVPLHQWWKKDGVNATLKMRGGWLLHPKQTGCRGHLEPCGGSAQSWAMSELLQNWLNNEVGLSTNVSNFEKDFSSGYLFGEILHKFWQADFEQFQNKNSHQAKIANFKTLEPILKALGIKFNATLINAVMNGERGAALRYFKSTTRKSTHAKVRSEPPEKRQRCGTNGWSGFGSGQAERCAGKVKILAKVADATGSAAQPSEAIACGIGYLDHMLDQLNSHGQLRVSVQAWLGEEKVSPHSNDAYSTGCDHEAWSSRSRLTVLRREDGCEMTRRMFSPSPVAKLVGSALGAAVKEMLQSRSSEGSFRFLVPLDEALTDLSLTFPAVGAEALPSEVALAPFGKFPPAGRTRIGSFRTCLTEVVLQNFAKDLNVCLTVKKLRGDNAHHIVEATFKSLARCLRCALDAFLQLDLQRHAVQLAVPRETCKQRGTKETNIDISLNLDAPPEPLPGRRDDRFADDPRDGYGWTGMVMARYEINAPKWMVQWCSGSNPIINPPSSQLPCSISTGLSTLDALLRKLSTFRIRAKCSGDVWIDEHHSTEDVMITVGQALHVALGSKAGCCRMAWAEAHFGAAKVLCVMDLSNRPGFCCDLRWHGQQEEMAEDVSVETLGCCTTASSPLPLGTRHAAAVLVAVTGELDFGSRSHVLVRSMGKMNDLDWMCSFGRSDVMAHSEDTETVELAMVEFFV
eukprot:s3485_g17.t1